MHKRSIFAVFFLLLIPLSWANPIEGGFRMLTDILTNTALIYGILFFLLFMMFYAIIAAASVKINIFSEGDKLNKNGKIFALVVALMIDLSLYFTSRTAGVSPVDFIQKILEPIGIIGGLFLGLIMFLLIKRGLGDEFEEMSWSIGLLAASLVLLLSAYVVSKPVVLSVGYLLATIAVVALLVQGISKIRSDGNNNVAAPAGNTGNNQPGTGNQGQGNNNGNTPPGGGGNGGDGNNDGGTPPPGTTSFSITPHGFDDFPIQIAIQKGAEDRNPTIEDLIDTKKEFNNRPKEETTIGFYFNNNLLLIKLPDQDGLKQLLFLDLSDDNTEKDIHITLAEKEDTGQPVIFIGKEDELDNTDGFKKWEPPQDPPEAEPNFDDLGDDNPNDEVNQPEAGGN